MILYRGTPEPESIPTLRAYPVVFFAFDYVEVVDYATGGEQEPEGFVQEYLAPDDLNLLDLDEPAGIAVAEDFLGKRMTKAAYLDLLHYPPKEWIEKVREMGFDGIVGNYVLLFTVAGLRLLRRWRLTYNEDRRRYDAEVVYDVTASLGTHRTKHE